MLRCETRKEFDDEYKKKKELWTLPGYLEYFKKNILKDIDRSGLWTAREHGWKVTISDVLGCCFRYRDTKSFITFFMIKGGVYSAENLYVYVAL